MNATKRLVDMALALNRGVEVPNAAIRLHPDDFDAFKKECAAVTWFSCPVLESRVLGVPIVVDVMAPRLPRA